MHALTLAFGWFPEVKGITVVLIGAGVMIGGSYLIVATNIGGRLGLLVTMAGLFGWMASMGIIWWSYGIGLKGREPTWKPKEIITSDLTAARYKIANDPALLQATETERSVGWIKLNEANPKRGQTVASADEIVQKGGVFAVGDYQAVAVYDKGGERWPKITFKAGKFGEVNLDYIAFRHNPHYAVVELMPLVKQATEPGKAPPTPIVDTSQPPRFVVMIRDMGSKRQPSVFITLGSSIIFGLLCYMLHKRDRIVTANRSGALVPATAGD